MHGKVLLSLVVLLGIVLAIAGCASTQAPAPVATPAPAAPAVTSSGSPSGASSAVSSGGSLVPSPTDVVPASRTLTLNVEKDYLGNVVVTFQGGAGNGHVQNFAITVNRADGQVGTGTLGINIGDTVTIPGTKDTDRVIIVASMDDGKSYKVFDKAVAFRTLG